MVIVIENMKDGVADKDGMVIVSLDLREITKGFAFLALPLINTDYVDDFKQERKSKLILECIIVISTVTLLMNYVVV